MDPEKVRAFASRAAASAEALFPGTVIVDGTEIPCAMGEPPGAVGVVPGGLELTADLLIVVRKELLPIQPERGKTMEARGKTWVVVSVTGSNFSSAVWSIHCEPHN